MPDSNVGRKKGQAKASVAKGDSKIFLAFKNQSATVRNGSGFGDHSEETFQAEIPQISSADGTPS